VNSPEFLALVLLDDVGGGTKLDAERLECCGSTKPVAVIPIGCGVTALGDVTLIECGVMKVEEDTFMACRGIECREGVISRSSLELAELVELPPGECVPGA
jgi:hypothetical protein